VKLPFSCFWVPHAVYMSFWAAFKSLQCDEPSLAEKAKQLPGKASDKVHQATEKVVDLTHKAGVPIPATSVDSEHLKWERTFNTNAQEIDQEGVRYLDEDQFINAIAPREDFIKIGKRQYGLLFQVADTKRRGLVTFDEFVAFETLLKQPDAEFRVAFALFDVDGNGELTFDEFKEVFSRNLGPKSLPFDFETRWLKMYMGQRTGQHVMGYSEFTQLMKGLQGERIRQAFSHLDKDGSGYISPGDFSRIIKEMAAHKLNDRIIDRLPTLCQLTASGRVSYSELRAFINVIKEIDLVEIIVKQAINKSRDSRISRDDFLNAAAQFTRYGVFTPLEADIIFHFTANQ